MSFVHTDIKIIIEIFQAYTSGTAIAIHGYFGQDMKGALAWCWMGLSGAIRAPEKQSFYISPVWSSCDMPFSCILLWLIATMLMLQIDRNVFQVIDDNPGLGMQSIILGPLLIQFNYAIWRHYATVNKYITPIWAIASSGKPLHKSHDVTSVN